MGGPIPSRAWQCANPSTRSSEPFPDPRNARAGTFGNRVEDLGSLIALVLSSR